MEDQTKSVYNTKIGYDAAVRNRIVFYAVKEFLQKDEDFLKLKKDQQDFIIFYTLKKFVKEIKEIIIDFNK